MEFIIIVFATFAVVEAVAYTEGPLGIFTKLRSMKYSKPFECFTCCAFWAGWLIAGLMGGSLMDCFILGIAGAGGAIFLDYIGNK